ncbi:MAG: DUF2585 family protein [Acidobacteriota bacterium]|nr:MAG: DUF2585 family protein [Acidobacteriota bacterium]
MGRLWWCEVGDWALWSGEVYGPHNSQHLVDPYTFTHILHGIGLYAVLWTLLKSLVTPVSRAVIALSIESAWEVVENTNSVIQRYREATISLGYYGDTIANSVADILACAGGYVWAMWIPVWASSVGFVLLEVTLLIWIRDSLLLNILMLIRPVEAIRSWQSGG